MDVETIITMLTSIFTALFVFYWQRRQAKRDKATDARASARAEESLLGMEMNFATAKLSHATALAVKSGRVNGEMAEAEKAFEDAKKAYTKFLNKQAKQSLEK